MEWTLSGEALTLSVSLKNLGQFVVPDAGSLQLTIRDNSGSVLAAYNKVSLPDIAASDLQVEIPSDVNTLTAGTTFESRFVVIDYQVSTVPLKAQLSYRISEFLPIQADAGTVLDFLGALDTEIDPTSIDLISAYYDLYPSYTTKLKDSLISGGLASLKVNNAIALKAALNLLPSLPARMMQSEDRDTSSYKRKIDFDVLQDSLEASLYENLRQMEAALAGTTATVITSTLLAITSPTDPITNQ